MPLLFSTRFKIAQRDLLALSYLALAVPLGRSVCSKFQPLPKIVLEVVVCILARL